MRISAQWQAQNALDVLLYLEWFILVLFAPVLGNWYQPGSSGFMPKYNSAAGIHHKRGANTEAKTTEVENNLCHDLALKDSVACRGLRFEPSWQCSCQMKTEIGIHFTEGRLHQGLLKYL